MISAGNGGKTNGLTPPACVLNGLSVGAVYDVDGTAPITWSLQGQPGSYCTDSAPVVDVDRVTCFSNTEYYLDMVAPGAWGTSASHTGAGTSHAASLTSGAVAVVRAAIPGLSVSQTMSRVTNSGKCVTDHRTLDRFHRLDVYAAVLGSTVSCP